MTPAGLRRIRKALGLTQKALAKALGGDRVSVTRWETGVRRITEPIARLVQRIRQVEAPKAEEWSLAAANVRLRKAVAAEVDRCPTYERWGLRIILRSILKGI